MYFQRAQFEEPNLAQFPCISNPEPHGVSSRYRMVSSGEVVNYLGERGYKVAVIQSGRPGSLSAASGRHLVRLRKHQEKLTVDDCFPEVILDNSYDGGSGLSLTVGLHRVACSNGLIMGGGYGGFFHKLPHVGSIREEVFGLLDDLEQKVVEIPKVVSVWGHRKLSDREASDLAIKALDMRFPTKVGSWGESDVERVLRHHRPADAGESLWAVFNRLQENCTKAGRFELPARTKKGRRRCPELRAVSRVSGFNRGLWEAAAALVS